MANSDLAQHYRSGLQAVPEGVSEDDIVALARGEHLGERHDAVLARVAGSEAGALALAIAREIEPAARALADARYADSANISALPARPARRFAWASPEALAAGVVAVAIAATLAFRAEHPTPHDAVAVNPAGDMIFGDSSYESDLALASSMESDEAPDAVFTDAFDS
jgi:hypothetical protein